MKYAPYDENNLEQSGNLLLVNPEGIDEQAKTVQDGTYQYVCQKCGKPLDRWYNGNVVILNEQKIIQVLEGIIYLK